MRAEAAAQFNSLQRQSQRPQHVRPPVAGLRRPQENGEEQARARRRCPGVALSASSGALGVGNGNHAGVGARARQRVADFHRRIDVRPIDHAAANVLAPHGLGYFPPAQRAIA